MAAFPSPGWLLGCGNMAGAMVSGWHKAGVEFSGVTVVRPSGTPVFGIPTVTSLPNNTPRLVMLGFKPQKLGEVVDGLAKRCSAETIIVSLLAGVSVASLRQMLPAAGPIIRVMPNLAVAQRQGVIGFLAEDPSAVGVEEVRSLMAGLGLLCDCRNEQELGVIGAVAASGMAYVARFAEALATSATKLGLDASQAARLALQTLAGTASYAAEEEASMAEVARRVASPGGTTEQGLAVLDGPEGLDRLVGLTLEAAIARGRQLDLDAASRN